MTAQRPPGGLTVQQRQCLAAMCEHPLPLTRHGYAYFQTQKGRPGKVRVFGPTVIERLEAQGLARRFDRIAVATAHGLARLRARPEPIVGPGGRLAGSRYVNGGHHGRDDET